MENPEVIENEVTEYLESTIDSEQNELMKKLIEAMNSQIEGFQAYGIDLDSMNAQDLETFHAAFEKAVTETIDKKECIQRIAGMDLVVKKEMDLSTGFKLTVVDFSPSESS